jgi:hypothetical protein
MTRLAWLQSRTQTLVALGALAVLAIVLAVTGPHLVHLYDTNVATCVAHGDCDGARDTFLRNDRSLRAFLGFLVVVLPAIIGIFWGAPLVARELETGTFRLAWTQSVSRTHWLAVKLAVVGAISMAVAGLLSVIVTWWASPFDTVNANRFIPGTFDQRGIVAIGYVAFAFAFGVTTGVVIRRTVPAMATTLFVFVVTRLVTARWVRPNLMTPRRKAYPLDYSAVGFGRTNNGPIRLELQAPNLPDAWVQSTRIVDHAGNTLSTQRLSSICPSLINDLGLNGPPPGSGTHVRTEAPLAAKDALHECVARVAAKYHVVASYQPANRFWTFQVLELALFLAAALALCGFCFWWIRRRLA